MSHASDIFPLGLHDKIFRTDRGDVCLYLHEVWPSLLADLALLGPAVLISRSAQLALVSFCRQLDFTPVPGSTEMLDLSSGLCVDTANLGSVIAGQEAATGNLTFHFFDGEERALFKVALAPGADIDAFVQVATHYARNPAPLHPRRALRPHGRESAESAVLAEERAEFQAEWTSLDPGLGGDFLPGRREVRWRDALRLAGRDRALFLTKVGLMKAILAAHHHKMKLRLTAWQDGLHHETTVVPYRLERCGHCLHLFDVESEAHFYFESDLDVWAGFHGRGRVPALHLFSRDGRRRGLIQGAGTPEEIAAWNDSLVDGGLLE